MSESNGPTNGSDLPVVDPTGDGSSTPSLKLEDLVASIKSNSIKQVIVMTGAGLSTAAGIPDFRSPKTGLYANLEKYNLPTAESIFTLKYFKQHPEPFFALAGEIMPVNGKFLPTYAHYFIALLHKKGLLKRNFTQNIDGLEFQVGIPEEKLMAAHGSFSSATCMDTKKKVDPQVVIDAVNKGEVPMSKDGGVVKPDIVFFGEQLPKRFMELMDQDFDRDFDTEGLLIVMGTSLVVHPFASLADIPSCPRLLFNRELVGPWEGEGRKSDVASLGDLEGQIKEFAKLLGWGEELEELYNVGREAILQKAREGGVDTVRPSDDALLAASEAVSAKIVGASDKAEGRSVAFSEEAPKEAEAPAQFDGEEEEEGPAGGRTTMSPKEALRLAVVNGDADTATVLLEEGENANDRVPGLSKVTEKRIDKDGNATTIKVECSAGLIDIAVQQGNTAMVDVLLRKGCDPNLPDEGGLTPLMLAAQEGFGEVVTMLLDAQADVNSADCGGGTALIRAADRGHLEVARMLIQKGANVNHRGSAIGGTPLMWAVQGCHIEMAALLLSEGADKSIENNAGQTPLTVALFFEVEELVELLAVEAEEDA